MFLPTDLLSAQVAVATTNALQAHVLIAAPAAGVRIRVWAWGGTPGAIVPGAANAQCSLATQANVPVTHGRFLETGAWAQLIPGGITFPAAEQVRVLDHSSTVGPHGTDYWALYTVESV